MRKSRLRALYARTAGVVCLFCLCAPALAQSAKESEWPTYGADLANTRYRPLNQINASNFSQLELARSYKTDNLGPRPEYKLEGTLLMAKGVLYATGIGQNGRGRNVHAPKRMMHKLEVPLAFAALQIDTHKAFAQEIVSPGDGRRSTLR